MPRQPNEILVCFLCALALAALDDLRADAGLAVTLALAWAAAAGAAAWRLRGSGALPVVLLAAGLGLRAIALWTAPQLSDDLFRYLWEGRVQLAGLSPFLHPPADPALAALRDPIWEAVNHKQVSTIYPPGALWLFEAVSAVLYAPLGWKLLAGAADFGVLLLITAVVRGRGGAAWAPALYALHPLPVLESAGSGHLESVALLGLAGAVLLSDRGRPGAALLAATGGALVKLLPAVAALPLLRAHGRALLKPALAAAAITAALSLPHLEAGATLLRGFNTYYESWSFNASFFRLIQWALGDPLAARPVGVALGAALCAAALWRLRDPARLALFVAGALVLLSPVVHPWYVLWALAPALMVGAWPWAVLATTALLSYLVLGTYDPATDSWSEPAWIIWVEYPPLLLAGLWWWGTRARPWTPPDRSAPGGSPSPSPTGPAG